MRPFEMNLENAVERLEALRAESRNYCALHATLGNWRRQIAAGLLALARHLEPDILPRRNARAS